MSLVLRVSTSSFEFPFWTHNLFTGFQIIAEIINRGHLYVPLTQTTELTEYVPKRTIGDSKTNMV